MVSNSPLAERMRPKSLDDFVGQSHLLGEEGILKRQILSGRLPSIILWGPPGVGKTTLAQIIATTTKRSFYSLSAINSGVKDIREVISKVKNNHGLYTTQNPILFIDEIHRFSKSQQDSLLEAVEKGWITLIGATTENPSFEVVSALLSRSQVYVLKTLEIKDLETIIYKALQNDLILINKKIKLKETEAILRLSGGDARRLLNILELVCNTASSDTYLEIDNILVEQTIQNTPLNYDKNADTHYDIASALIKSIRGSDPNAAVYWLARMINAGEDVKFIARRLLISASEDIGLANPTALVIANNCFNAVSVIGFPESRIILSQCVIYLATSAKSNTVYQAINSAQDLVIKTGNQPVPLHLRNASTKLMKDLNYGSDYKYAHEYQGNFIDQEFFPETLSKTQLYHPGKNAKENSIRSWLKQLWTNRYNY